MLQVLRYASLHWLNSTSTRSRQDLHLLLWSAFHGTKVAAQPLSLRADMHIAVLFARALIVRRRALAIPAGTAAMTANDVKVPQDLPLVQKLAALKELLKSAVCSVRTMCSCLDVMAL